MRGAAALAAAYLARKDRVGLIEYGGQPRWVRPGAGRAQLERLLDTLLDASVVFTYVNRDLDLVPPRILPPQALVLALSPLLDARFVRAATDLAARGFDLVVIAVSPVAAARAAAAPGRGRRRGRAAVGAGAPRASSTSYRRGGLDHRRVGRRRAPRCGPGPAAAAAASPRARRMMRLAGARAPRGPRRVPARPSGRAARHLARARPSWWARRG